MYAKGTDITKLPYTDTMGTNPLYAGFFDISPYRPGMAQPLPPASQGTPYAAYSPTSKSNASFSQSNSPQQALWRLTQPNTQGLAAIGPGGPANAAAGMPPRLHK